jgi:hypothetical protein
MFDLKDLEKCTKSKEEMWNELNGKTVKCIHVQDGEFHLFSVLDLETKITYIIDWKIPIE